MERVSKIERKTSETEIVLELNLDGKGLCSVDCPVGFLGHMLSAFCKHGLFDLSGSLKGDLYVDQHHLIEDTGIVLGEAFNKALGDKAGINGVPWILGADHTLLWKQGFPGFHFPVVFVPGKRAGIFSPMFFRLIRWKIFGRGLFPGLCAISILM